MKRAFDFASALLGLLILLPLLIVVVLVVKLDSPGSAFFGQTRVGKDGTAFKIFKFRTMREAVESSAPKVTSSDDQRITKSGRWLRRFKLDELPQLWNVLRGDMSLVGPRPEVPEYVEFYPPDVRERVLSVRPGLTDYAAIEFRHEEELLRGSADPVATYRAEILPIKLRLYLRYIEEMSFLTDIKILLRTVKVVLGS